jgi:hypothetical protein
MSKVKVIRKGNGEAFVNQKSQFVFVKDGVHFSLSLAEMDQMAALIVGLKDGSLAQIDPLSEDMARGE